MTKQEELVTLESIISMIQTRACVYNIHFCRAGWGFIMHYPEKQRGDDFRTGLSVEHYYDTIREAAEKTLELVNGN